MNGCSACWSPGGDRSTVLRIPAVSFIPSRCKASLLFQTVYAGNKVFDEGITLSLIAGQNVNAAPEVAHIRRGGGQLLQHILLDVLHLLDIILRGCALESLVDHASQIVKRGVVGGMLRHLALV